MADEVLLFNSKSKLLSKKLKSKWSGPFVVTNVYTSGAIELKDHEKKRSTVNGHRLKHYYVDRLGAAKV